MGTQYYAHQRKAMKLLSTPLQQAKTNKTPLDPTLTHQELVRNGVYVSEKWVREYLESQGATDEHTKTVRS